MLLLELKDNVCSNNVRADDSYEIIRLSERPDSLEATLSVIWTAKKAGLHMYIFTRAPDAGAWGPPVLRGECEEVFVFELSGTHELHAINTTYQGAMT